MMSLISIPDNASENFITRIGEIDVQAIADFLECQTRPVYETQLLKFITEKTSFELESLTLYQNHFILFYILYSLQDYFNKKDKYLHVHFMRTGLFDIPDERHCHYFDENLLRFCCEECDGNYCDFHKKYVGGGDAVEELSVKYFYLDTDNYDKLDAETADAFINGTWEILANYGNMKHCYEVMELPETYDVALIKKQFRFLAKKYHPDVSADSGKHFNEINRAYKILINTIPVVKKDK